MANIFGDMRFNHVTPKELEAMRIILTSERAAVMLKELNKTFATMDSKAPSWLLTILTEIISYVTTLANNHITSMQNWVSTLGRMLTLDTTKSGSRARVNPTSLRRISVTWRTRATGMYSFICTSSATSRMQPRRSNAASIPLWH